MLSQPLPVVTEVTSILCRGQDTSGDCAPLHGLSSCLDLRCHTDCGRLAVRRALPYLKAPLHNAHQNPFFTSEAPNGSRYVTFVSVSCKDRLHAAFEHTMKSERSLLVLGKLVHSKASSVFQHSLM